MGDGLCNCDFNSIFTIAACVNQNNEKYPEGQGVYLQRARGSETDENRTRKQREWKYTDLIQVAFFDEMHILELLFLTIFSYIY